MGKDKIVLKDVPPVLYLQIPFVKGTNKDSGVVIGTGKII